MSQFIPLKFSWTDNSTGDFDEDGTEIDIYTDSPSFVPNVPVEPGGTHAWMRLPAVAGGETEAGFRLETPVTFVVARTRQYNAGGPGPWDSVVGTNFPLSQAIGTTVPPAPSALGLVITDVTVPPPPPPVDPPPPPPPTGGGGVSSNYAFTAQFSGVQGQNGWSYRDSSGTLLVYAGADAKWNGNELYLAIWNGGFRHSSSGSTKDVVLRWTAPSAGVALVTGTAGLYTAPGSARFVAKHNSTTKFTQDMSDTTVYPYSFSATMAAGDTLDFIEQLIGSTLYNNNCILNPVINFTTDGSTPANPTVSAVSPSTASVSVGGALGLTVSLTSAPSAPVSVAVSSSDPTKATVPATVTVPAGQTSASVIVTGVAAGSTTITATYNSSQQTAAVTVVNPPSSSWANSPAGSTVLFDSGLANLTGLIDFYGTTILATDTTAPFSPPNIIKGRLEPLNKTGGNQLHFQSPTTYREMYVGLYWRTNPQFQGRSVSNKMFFLRSKELQSNGFIGFGNGVLSNGRGPLVFAVNGGASNQHILGPQSDSGSFFFPNVGNGTLTVGVWHKLEWRLRASTSITSQDGILQIWVNDVLTHSYLNLNYSNGFGLNEWVMNQTWDGSGDMGQVNTVAWEHCVDHIRITGKN